ncbi:aminotransferase class III-fold pyridoxal phosphate-dependent enzyme [Streptomyces melanosporofaciens]|uniref:aminotransferase class III-fold pyridoxal phosphate-dependent enzyme n=1 Tax=unclassified Streptomyces TaxID=2593676 RepID=UPI0033D00BDC
MDDLMNCLTANSISTSRGNPIAMATGNAVLDFIDSHELQANAVEVGRFLFDGLRELATRYSLIGEVRGTGLMLGFELIEPKTKVPAVAATNAVLAQCRERGLLIGKGGLLGNVLRVTPPMTVTLFLRRWFVLFFIDHGTRHVHIAGITPAPDRPLDHPASTELPRGPR